MKELQADTYGIHVRPYVLIRSRESDKGSLHRVHCFTVRRPTSVDS